VLKVDFVKKKHKFLDLTLEALLNSSQALRKALSDCAPLRFVVGKGRIPLPEKRFIEKSLIREAFRYKPLNFVVLED